MGVVVKIKSRNSTSGQTLVEYVLLTMMVAGLFTLLVGPMRNMMARLEAPLREKLKFAYKYGHPEACGKDDDLPCTGPKMHPRYDLPGNFRMVGRK